MKNKKYVWGLTHADLEELLGQKLTLTEVHQIINLWKTRYQHYLSGGLEDCINQINGVPTTTTRD